MAKRGAVYVFVRCGTTWTQEARLDGRRSSAARCVRQQRRARWRQLLIGAPLKPGRARRFCERRRVRVRARCRRLVAAGQADCPASANGELFGFAVDLAGDRAIIGAPYALRAKARIRLRANGGAWSQQAELAAGRGAAGDEFGWSVAIGDDSILVGAPFAGQLAAARMRWQLRVRCDADGARTQPERYRGASGR